MKAVGFTEPGSPDVLTDIEIDKPKPSGRDLLVNVHAVSVNPVDYKIRAGRRPPPNLADAEEAQIIGWDAVGEVVEVGKDVTLFSPGDMVWYAGAINRSGTNAEFHLVDERIVGRKPSSASNAEAAALPLTTLTAWEMLFDRLKVTEPVLGAAPAVVIIGGAGGVGSIAIQLLRAKPDLTVVATASRPETQAWCAELGAHHVVDHSQPLAEQIAALDIGAPAFAFGTNHSEQYLAQIAEFIAPQGRFGLIDDPPEFDIRVFKPKSISIHWELMFTRSMFQTEDMARQGEILNATADLLDAGTIRSTATETLGAINAANLRLAHSQLETGKAKGKIVLEGF
jgi:NADPH2:quinone reductase